MSTVIRGYRSVTINLTGIDTSKTSIDLRGRAAGGSGISARIRIKNIGSNAAQLYFDDPTTFITLAAGEVYAENVEVSRFDVAAATATTSLDVQALCLPSGPPPV